MFRNSKKSLKNVLFFVHYYENLLSENDQKFLLINLLHFLIIDVVDFFKVFEVKCILAKSVGYAFLPIKSQYVTYLIGYENIHINK